MWVLRGLTVDERWLHGIESYDGHLFLGSSALALSSSSLYLQDLTLWLKNIKTSSPFLTSLHLTQKATRW
jgi:hypothetical protein